MDQIKEEIVEAISVFKQSDDVAKNAVVEPYLTEVIETIQSAASRDEIKDIVDTLLMKGRANKVFPEFYYDDESSFGCLLEVLKGLLN